MLKPGTLAVLQRATEGRVHFGADEPTFTEQRLPLPCPRDLEAFFTTLTTPRDVVKTYLKATPPVIGTTHLEPAFALGTVNRGEFWNQRRGLVAYWGKANHPSYLHLRFLRDDYDFSAAQFFSAQRGGEVLAAVNFGTDGGNTHIGLDRLKNGVFRAKDLRLRFEFGGAAGQATLTAPAKLTESARIAFNDLHLALLVPQAVFGEEQPRWEAGQSDGRAWLDVVVYHGADREFRLGEIRQAALGLALRLSAEQASPPAINSSLRDGRLSLEWDKLRVSVPVQPDKVGVLQQAVRY